MNMNVEVITDKDTLDRFNFQEEAIAFYDDNQMVAIQISRVSGLAIKKMLREWIRD